MSEENVESDAESSSNSGILAGGEDDSEDDVSESSVEELKDAPKAVEKKFVSKKNSKPKDLSDNNPETNV